MSNQGERPPQRRFLSERTPAVSTLTSASLGSLGLNGLGLASNPSSFTSKTTCSGGSNDGAQRGVGKGKGAANNRGNKGKDVPKRTCHKCAAKLGVGFKLRPSNHCADCGTYYHLHDCGGRFKDMLNDNVPPEEMLQACIKCQGFCICTGGPIMCHAAKAREKREKKRMKENRKKDNLPALSEKELSAAVAAQLRRDGALQAKKNLQFEAEKGPSVSAMKEVAAPQGAHGGAAGPSMDATANPTWIGGGVSAILAAQKCTQDLVQADQRAKLAMQRQPLGETPAAPSSRGDASGSDKRKEAVQQRLLLLQEDWEGQMREARAQHADLLNSGEQSSRAGTFLPQTAQQADQRTEFSDNDPLGLREPEPDDLLPAVMEHAVQHCIRPKGVQLVGLRREGVQIVGEVGDIASMRAAQTQALLEQQEQLTKLQQRHIKQEQAAQAALMHSLAQAQALEATYHAQYVVTRDQLRTALTNAAIVRQQEEGLQPPGGHSVNSELGQMGLCNQIAHAAMHPSIGHQMASAGAVALQGRLQDATQKRRRSVTQFFSSDVDNLQRLFENQRARPDSDLLAAAGAHAAPPAVHAAFDTMRSTGHDPAAFPTDAVLAHGLQDQEHRMQQARVQALAQAEVQQKQWLVPAGITIVGGMEDHLANAAAGIVASELGIGGMMPSEPDLQEQAIAALSDELNNFSILMAKPDDLAGNPTAGPRQAASTAIARPTAIGADRSNTAGVRGAMPATMPPQQKLAPSAILEMATAAPQVDMVHAASGSLTPLEHMPSSHVPMMQVSTNCDWRKQAPLKSPARHADSTH